MTQEHWQLQIANKSLKKKEKLKLLDKHLCVDPSALILDLGCAQGILSYFLRRKGGFWISADQDLSNLITTQKLLKENLIQIEAGVLPFKSSSLDMVVSLDYLEHLEDDQLCLEEIHRVLKKDGLLIMATPRTGKLFLLNRLRPLLGMKLEFYGHLREGYNLKHLKSKLEKAHLFSVQHRRFSGFFTEFIELILNFLYIKIFSPPAPTDLRDGHIRPSTEDEFRSQKKAFKAYAWIYPVVWFFSRLDKLFFWQRGYGLMIWAQKTDLSEKTHGN